MNRQLLTWTQGLEKNTWWKIAIYSWASSMFYKKYSLAGAKKNSPKPMYAYSSRREQEREEKSRREP